MAQPFHAIDRLAMAVGGALILLGVPVLGLFELLDGAPYGAAAVTNDAGQVVATPLIDPNIRTGLVILGLLVFLLWGLYRMASPVMDVESTRREVPAAD